MHKSPIASKRKFDEEPMSKSPAVSANELQQYIVRMKLQHQALLSENQAERHSTAFNFLNQENSSLTTVSTLTANSQRSAVKLDSI